jgi:hypothetical protein
MNFHTCRAERPIHSTGVSQLTGMYFRIPARAFDEAAP